METTSGSVFKRKDGRWVARYWIDGKSKLIYGKTEDEAVKRRQVMLDKLQLSLLPDDSGLDDEQKGAHNQNNNDGNILNSGAHGTNTIENTSDNDSEQHIPGMTLGEWLYEWLESYVKPGLNITTYKGYELYIENHIVPEIGGIKLQALSTSVFQNFFDKKSAYGRIDGKAGGMSPRSVGNMRYMLNAAIRQAVENDLVTENYIECITTSKAEKREVFSLMPEEEERLIAACIRHDNIAAFGIILALHTGLQLGELLALKWSDVDMVKSEIYVNQSLSRGAANYDINSRTTLRFSMSKSVRVLSENDVACGLFTELAKYNLKQARVFGDNPDVVIASSAGSHMDPSNYNKLFKRVLEDTEILKLNFDVLRNTFALRQLEKGIDPAELSLVLGCGENSKPIKKYVKAYLQRLA